MTSLLNTSMPFRAHDDVVAIPDPRFTLTPLAKLKEHEKYESDTSVYNYEFHKW